MTKDRTITMAEFNGENTEIAKMRVALAQMVAMAPLIIEHQRINAGLIRAKYDALVAEGFDPK